MLVSAKNASGSIACRAQWPESQAVATSHRNRAPKSLLIGAERVTGRRTVPKPLSASGVRRLPQTNCLSRLHIFCIGGQRTWADRYLDNLLSKKILAERSASPGTHTDITSVANAPVRRPPSAQLSALRRPMTPQIREPWNCSGDADNNTTLVDGRTKNC